jgi:hypothetical protein
MSRGITRNKYNTAEKALDEEIRQGLEAEAGITAFLKCHLPWESVIIEGIAITPEFALKLKEEFVDIIFTFSFLIDGTYQSKDYSPDAYYEKVTGNYDCTFDTMIAYANPHPPAINSTLMCVRTVNLFGTPPNEFYSSSKGHLGT